MVKGYRISFWVMNEDVPKLIGVVCTILNITKNIESYTLNGEIVWYVNYI